MNTRINTWANLSAIATALIAVLALIIAIWQIQAAQHIQREASAREAFKEYLKMAIEKPNLADGQLAQSDKPELKQAYDWFVTYFLYSAEQIYETYPTDLSWHSSLKEEICFHQPYLSHPDQQERIKQQYSADFAAFVLQSLNECS